MDAFININCIPAFTCIFLAVECVQFAYVAVQNGMTVQNIDVLY